jgi:hypothetical protein
MKKILMVLSALVVGACSHHSNDSTMTQPPPSTTVASDNGEPPIDPTLPSWAPPSCSHYHRAVLKLISCEAVAQNVRDAAKSKYDADDAKWRAMTDQPQGAIEAVRQSCADAATSARDQLAGRCP